MIKYKCILVIFFLSVSNGYTQNLILNGSFEELDTTKSGFARLLYWQQSPNNSPDLFWPYGQPSFNSSDDTSFFGYQLPQHGNNYIGGYYFASGGGTPQNFLREIVIGNVFSTLGSGKLYCFTFYISLADIFNCAVKQIDAYFSSTPHDPTLNVAPHLIYYPPQFSADTSNFYDNKLNWVKIEGSYTAVGNENYVTIGNLHLDNDTDTLCSGSIAGYPNQNHAYYFMDNFSLEEIKPVDAGNDIFINTGNSTVIGNNSDSASTYSWSPNYFIDDTNAVNPTVNPPVTTTYYVSKTQCSVTTVDSVTVVVAPLGVSEFSNSTNVRLYPNPNNGTFYITHQLPLENNVYIEVMDLTGKIVHREMLTSGNQQVVKTQQLNTGLYFVNFISDSGELMYSTKMSITHE